MASITKKADGKYHGTDAEIAKALADTFPQFRFTKRCSCVDQGVVVRQENTIYDDTFSVPHSLTVLCLACDTPFIHG